MRSLLFDSAGGRIPSLGDDDRAFGLRQATTGRPFLVGRPDRLERGLQMRSRRADTWNVRFRRPTTDDRIAEAFAEAVAAGNLEAAEGWLTVAALRADRAGDRRRGARAELADRRILR
jgi:hypothetical protein